MEEVQNVIDRINKDVKQLEKQPGNREISLSITKLQEAVMWLEKAVGKWNG